MPEILLQGGKQIKTRVLENDAEYFEWLRRKLLEEVQEMAEITGKKTLAPIEVARFLAERLAYLDEIEGIMAELKGITPEDIQKKKEHIITERGEFKKRLLLEP
jgi:predicted house-cleaning noncanonical NTP pyrophosphatase (MazG superfamily)